MATRVEGTLYYVHSDLLGSTVAVSDAAGGEVGRVQYDPYGEILTSTLPADLTDRLFTGARFDGTIGLYQMGARWYDPALGRWIQADTIVPDPGNPQALNRYSYVYNNPLRFVDPTGHGGPVDWLTGQIIAFGSSGDVGRVLVIGTAEAVHHLNRQTQKVFYPDENTGTAERLWACVEIGGGSVVVAAIATELAFGTLTTAALSGGAAEVATTAGTATTAACADGDCTNEVTGAGQAAQQGLNVFSRSAEFGIRTYNELRGLIRGTGLQAHHIIEQRFARILGLSPGQMQSVALTPEEHQVFTNAWRNAIGYANSGNPINTLTATTQDIWLAAQRIYADYPVLLEAVRQTLFGE